MDQNANVDQNTNTEIPVTPVVDNKQKSGKGLKITTAIACIVAVCGIGFGVYGMIQSSQKDGQISDLKAQIKEDDGTITTIETPEIESTTDNGTTVTITDSVAKNESSDDYIYIGNWGMKIKIPEDLTIVHYGFVNNGYHRTCSQVRVSAVTNSDGLEAINNVDDWEYTLGYIMRCPTEDKFYYGSLVFSDDGYDYYYEFPNGLSTEDPQWMHDSVGLIKDMLTNPDSYSAI